MNVSPQITPRIREVENFPWGGGRSDICRFLENRAVPQKTAPVIDGIIRVFHIEVHPIIRQFPFCLTVSVMERIRKEQDKFVLPHVIICHVLGNVQGPFYYNDQNKRINVSFWVYKTIFACQVAAGDIFHRFAGIRNKIEHGIPPGVCLKIHSGNLHLHFAESDFQTHACLVL